MTILSTLTIPPTRAEEVGPVKDFLFEIYGESQWTEEKYLELSEQTNRLIEFSEGRLAILPMPTPEHQDLVWNIGEFLKAWARKHKGRMFVSPLPIRLSARKFREPDLVLYAAQHLDRIKKQFGEPPDLAVEVLSPGTAKTDLDEKLSEYARAGIAEYWIVSVGVPQIKQYVLDADHYRLHATSGAGDIVRAVTLAGLEVALAEVYRQH